MLLTSEVLSMTIMDLFAKNLLEGYLHFAMGIYNTIVQFNQANLLERKDSQSTLALWLYQ
jgi:hypothetical protein